MSRRLRCCLRFGEASSSWSWLLTPKRSLFTEDRFSWHHGWSRRKDVDTAAMVQGWDVRCSDGTWMEPGDSHLPIWRMSSVCLPLRHARFDETARPGHEIWDFMFQVWVHGLGLSRSISSTLPIFHITAINTLDSPCTEWPPNSHSIMKPRLYRATTLIPDPWFWLNSFWCAEDYQKRVLKPSSLAFRHLHPQAWRKLSRENREALHIFQNAQVDATGRSRSHPKIIQCWIRWAGPKFRTPKFPDFPTVQGDFRSLPVSRASHISGEDLRISFLGSWLEADWG